MRALMVGDIVGGVGRSCFARVVAAMRQQEGVDFVVANAENAAGGRGLTPALADDLFAAGADALTLGDHVWDQKEIAKALDREPRIVRPANCPPGCPGRGFVTLETKWGRVTVVPLLGRVFMDPADCPFRAMDDLLRRSADVGRIVLVDFHAEATSEKIVMGRYLDGRVSAVVGTHTHVQTSDEAILPRGTAYITDLGMTGPKDSALGRDLASVTGRFLTGMPTKFEIATHDVMLEGVVVEIDETTGRAKAIRRVRRSA